MAVPPISILEPLKCSSSRKKTVPSCISAPPDPLSPVFKGSPIKELEQKHGDLSDKKEIGFDDSDFEVIEEEGCDLLPRTQILRNYYIKRHRLSWQLGLPVPHLNIDDRSEGTTPVSFNEYVTRKCFPEQATVLEVPEQENIPINYFESFRSVIRAWTRKQTGCMKTLFHVTALLITGIVIGVIGVFLCSGQFRLAPLPQSRAAFSEQKQGPRALTIKSDNFRDLENLEVSLPGILLMKRIRELETDNWKFRQRLLESRKRSSRILHKIASFKPPPPVAALDNIKIGSRTLKPIATEICWVPDRNLVVRENFVNNNAKTAIRYEQSVVRRWIQSFVDALYKVLSYAWLC